MTRDLARRCVLAACLLAIMLAPLASISPSIASNQPNSFHWARKQRQFTIQAISNVDGVWNKLLRNAINDWNDSGTVTIKEKSGSHNASQNCNPTKGKIEVCNWNYGTQEGWLGLTRLYFNNAGDHVDAATVQMNDSYFNQKNGQYNNTNARRHTICHEMGHAIGLDHVNTTSCLNHDLDTLEQTTTPIKKDYRQLERIYKHKDSTTTVAGKQKKSKKDKRKKRKRGKAESGGFFAPTSLPAVPSGLEGEQTEIVQRLDDGTKVVTFITWADE